MSTKIFEGRIARNIDAVTLISLIKEKREKIDEIITQKSASSLADHVVHQRDRAFLNLSSIPENGVWGKAVDCMIDQLSKETITNANSIIEYALDTLFEICVYPLTNTTWLIVPFSRCEEAKDFFFENEVFEYYGYWNNTDPDEDVTEEEWKQREEDWYTALPGIGIPAHEMFTITLCPDKMLITLNDVMDNLPSFEQRVKSCVTDLSFKHFSDINDIDINSSNFTRILFNEFPDWKKKNPRTIQKIKSDIKQQLPKQITKEYITEKP